MTQDVAQDPYAAKPWLPLYATGLGPTLIPEHGDMLSLFRAALSDPSAPAIAATVT